MGWSLPKTRSFRPKKPAGDTKETGRESLEAVQTVQLEVYMDAHQVLWCDTAIQWSKEPVTIITMAPEKHPDRDLSANREPDTQSELQGATGMAGTLHGTVKKKEKEPFSPPKQAEDCQVAAQRRSTMTL